MLEPTTDKRTIQSKNEEKFQSPQWKALFKLLGSKSVKSIEEVRTLSEEILQSEGAENAIAFWDRLIDENKENPMLYSGRAQLYERLDDTIENAKKIVQDFSTAYSMSMNNSKYKLI